MQWACTLRDTAEMKSIKISEYRLMVKVFGLDELEADYLLGLTDDINAEKSSICESLQSDLVYGTNIAEKRTAINALLVYTAAKAQKDTPELRMRLKETTRAMSQTLKCSSYQICRWLKGASYNGKFAKFIDCHYTFGQNFLEITI